MYIIQPINTYNNIKGRKMLPPNSPPTTPRSTLGGTIQKVVRALTPRDQRLATAGLHSGGASVSEQTRTNGQTTNARFANSLDPRARLTLSPGSGNILYKDPNNILLKPLADSGGVVWPYTPTINSSYSAIYTPINPTHSNFNQQSYNNSVTNDITVIGQFTANTSEEARYVLAVINFLRSSNKMFFGQDQLKGTPPPVFRFSAYGPYMFNSVPVVVSQFSQDFESGVDYMATGLNPDENLQDISYVPTLMTVNVTLSPVYSRKQQTEFSLEKYARGDLIGSSKGRGGTL